MKILTYLLTAPLALFVWLCAGLLYLSAPLFGLASAVLTVLAVVVIPAGSLTNGIILLVISFLVCPLGLPILAAQILAGLQGLRMTRFVLRCASFNFEFSGEHKSYSQGGENRKCPPPA